ncbi:MAG: DUF58 domain-containing protein [Phycisphaerales bacterium]
MALALHANTMRPARRRDRLQLFTVVFVALALLVMLGAITSENNMLFWLVGVAIGSIIVSGLIAGPAMMAVRLGAVRCPTLFDPAAPSICHIEVVNRHRRRTVYALRIEVRFLGPRGGLLVLRGGCAAVAPGSSAVVPIPLSLPDRGLWRIHSVRVSTTFPFGLSNKLLVFKPAGAVIALPERAPVVIDHPAATGEEDLILTELLRKSEGETYALREYRPGDPRRQIAWRSSARSGRLIVREHASPAGRSVWLRPVASAVALRDRRPTAERTVSLTARLAELAEARGVRVGLWHPETGVLIAPGPAGAWRPALAQLGDRQGRVAHSAPPGTDVLDITAEAEP